MPLLTDTQIKQATKDDLLASLRSIHDHLDAGDEEAALVVARSTLARHGTIEPLRITFGVDEWDDGYFYSGIQRVVGIRRWRRRRSVAWECHETSFS